MRGLTGPSIVGIVSLLPDPCKSTFETKHIPRQERPNMHIPNFPLSTAIPLIRINLALNLWRMTIAIL